MVALSFPVWCTHGWITCPFSRKLLIPRPGAPGELGLGWSPSRKDLANEQRTRAKEETQLQRKTPRAKNTGNESQVFKDDKCLRSRFQGMEMGMLGRGDSDKGQAGGSVWATVGQR